MAVNFIDVDVDARQLQEFFVFAGFKARDLRDPLRKSMEEVVIPAVRDQILSQGVRSGNPYPPLDEEYERWKTEEVGFAYPMLIRSGDMLKALTDSTSYRVFRNSAYYRPQDIDYAHWHQTGGTKRGQPPRRVILSLIPEDEHHIQNIFQAWLAELRDANRARRGSALSPVFNIADHFDIL